MPEAIMQYDINEGDMVNLKRKEELIRCKDCKRRYETYYTGKRRMVCDFMDCQLSDYDFCSRAERKKE